ncbi:hypothetical protein [Paenibacillus beijingensis]|nr:hypothetical protein [Paenibacillus beijingensis]
MMERSVPLSAEKSRSRLGFRVTFRTQRYLFIYLTLLVPLLFL